MQARQRPPESLGLPHSGRAGPELGVSAGALQTLISWGTGAGVGRGGRTWGQEAPALALLDFELWQKILFEKQSLTDFLLLSLNNAAPDDLSGGLQGPGLCLGGLSWGKRRRCLGQVLKDTKRVQCPGSGPEGASRSRRPSGVSCGRRGARPGRTGGGACVGAGPAGAGRGRERAPQPRSALLQFSLSAAAPASLQAQTQLYNVSARGAAPRVRSRARGSPREGPRLWPPRGPRPPPGVPPAGGAAQPEAPRGCPTPTLCLAGAQPRPPGGVRRFG